MPVQRERPDGLPFNVYERRGLRVYRIWYKRPNPPREIVFTMTCAAKDAIAVAKTRRAAIKRSADILAGAPVSGTFQSLALAWLAVEQAKPEGSEGRRAGTTLAENAREIAKLNSVLGHVPVADLRRVDAYDYLEAAERSKRSAKANKEISLARTILEYAVRREIVAVNPFAGVEKLVTKKYDRRVTDDELALAAEMGRQAGGARLIVALALRTAYLCVRRSVEVRDFQLHQIKEDGIEWTGAKRKRGTEAKEGLIEWSPALRATIDEALAVKRFDKALATFYVFGNMMGQKYTKGGWKKMLSNLMDLCEAAAKERGIAFQKFSLQDCRPMGVTKRMERGDTDVQDATLHSNGKMIEATYDRRRVRTAAATE